MPHAPIPTPDFETYRMATPILRAALTDDTVTVDLVGRSPGTISPDLAIRQRRLGEP